VVAATVRVVAEVVERDDTPDTVSVPFEVSDEVAVIDPPLRIYEVRFAIVPERALSVEVRSDVEVKFVVTRLLVVAFVASRFVKDAVIALKRVALKVFAERFETEVVASVEVPLTIREFANVLSPLKDWVEVETTPLEVRDAFGILMMWEEEVEAMLMSFPATPVTRVWEDAVTPLRDVIPAPESDAHIVPSKIYIVLFVVLKYTLPLGSPGVIGGALGWAMSP
jgi:hypothetical protein